MDIELTEEQQQLMDTARRFVARECPLSFARSLESNETGFSIELHRRMGELGWLGLLAPERYGGGSLGMVDVAVLCRELGRGLVPGPVIPSAVVAASAITAAGTEAQQAALLPRVTSGDLVVAFAIQEGRRYDATGVQCSARADGEGFVLAGGKRFVEYAAGADQLLVLARTGGGPGEGGGLTMFLVDPHRAGVTMRALGTMARDHQCDVEFDDVRVPASDVLGPVGGGWPLLEPAVLRGVVAFCAYMVGAAQEIHAMATEFAKQRIQFDRPIGSFQSIQHYLAQSITEITSADTMTFYTAWMLDQGLPARSMVAKTKICAGDTVKQVSSLGAQIYGGLGYNEDVDTTLFLRRGKQWQLSMGDSGYWGDVLAGELLGV
jgi:alkylation response protein AidB-like acyl-CoA dehydrogenase